MSPIAKEDAAKGDSKKRKVVSSVSLPAPKTPKLTSKAKMYSVSSVAKALFCKEAFQNCSISSPLTSWKKNKPRLDRVKRIRSYFKELVMRLESP